MNKLITFISTSRFIHNMASFFVKIIPLFVLHNFSKYFSIKKILYSVNIDNIEGDYCEFGCFTGASLNHALNTYNAYMKNKKMTFYGFDSFEGFPIEVHEEFKSEFFIPDFEMVKKLEYKFNNCKIIKGFFDKSLTDEELAKSINKISFAFIDCDLGYSAKSVFEFIKPRLSNGAFIMIDDFYNIDKTNNSIFKTMKGYFSFDKDVFIHSYFGNGGVTFKYFKNNK